MKSFTSLEQSKKLAEILPLKSADMRYGHIAPYEFSDRMYDGGYDKVPYPKDFIKLCADFCEEDIYDGSLPCWSLASLLDILPHNLKLVLAINDYQGDRKEKYVIGSVEHDKYDCYADNPVDACVDMIELLHELNLL